MRARAVATGLCIQGTAKPRQLCSRAHGHAGLSRGQSCNSGGRILGVKPNLLVVPPSLEEAAHKIVAATNEQGGANPWAATAEVVVSAYLA